MLVQICGGKILTGEHPNFSLNNKSLPRYQSYIPNGLTWDRTRSNLCGTCSYIECTREGQMKTLKVRKNSKHSLIVCKLTTVILMV